MAVVEQSLESWLSERPTFIGASESPVIVGVGYANESLPVLWDRKVNPTREEIDREDFEWGHAIQPIALKMFARKTGLNVRDIGQYTVTRHPEYPWIGATLDAVADDPNGLAVVEAKNVGQYNAKEWSEPEPPLRVQVQIHHQMLAACANVGYAVACVGGNKLVWKRVERNQRFIDALIPKLAEFWGYVERRELPPVDESYATARLLSMLWPLDKGTTIVLGDEAREWDVQLVKAKADIKEAEAREAKYSSLLKAAMNEHTFAEIPGVDGRYSWKTQTEHHKPREACVIEKRVLRRVK